MNSLVAALNAAKVDDREDGEEEEVDANAETETTSNRNHSALTRQRRGGRG